ncbi:MAG: DUF5335 family protein [Acidobacteria bacterium]|nr:DUF5335 family protein [Acidobacteriota bacterium]
MNAPKRHGEWSKFLQFFTEQNRGRPTRLGVFERNGDSVIDYWIESGLVFIGVDIDPSTDSVTIQVLIGEMEHVVSEPQQIKFILSRSGDEDGIDITDSNGRTTVLRFEVAKTD